MCKASNKINIVNAKFFFAFTILYHINYTRAIIFPDVYKKIGEIKRNYVYKINAKVEKKDNTYQLIVYNMINLG